MSEILTAAQVAEIVRDSIDEFPFQNTKQFKRIVFSHESLRANYDDLLQGATAQKVATLMDEADKARVEIERLAAEVKEGIDAHYDMHAVRCNNCDAEILARVNGRDIECLSDGEESGDLALCGACMGKEFYALDAKFGTATARIAELEKERDAAQLDRDRYRNQREKAWKELDAAIAERDAALELAARREKENRLILRLHKRKQGISDDALQHSIAERDGEKLGRQILAGALEQAVQNGKRCADERDGLRGECAAALRRETEIALERDGLRGAIGALPVLLFEAAVFIEQVSFSSAISAKESDRLQWSGEKYREAEKIIASALAAVPAPVAQQGKSHAHQWFKNGDYREDSMFGISCPVWACGSCKITCSATDKPSENL